MKTPTLEQVKKHFENAKEVRIEYLPTHHNQILDISDRSIFDERQIHFSLNSYWLCKKEINNIMLWDGNKKQYAEIISYKDTYTVDKEFIKEAYDNPELLKDRFPSVFVSEPIELTMEQIADKFNVDVNLLKIKK